MDPAALPFWAFVAYVLDQLLRESRAEAEELERWEGEGGAALHR